MKKYTILYCFDAVANIEVLANSKEEARNKAREIELDLNDYDLQLNEEEVVKEEDVPDLNDLIQKATSIIKQYDEEGHEDYFAVPSYPVITTQCWNGDEFVKQKNVVEDFYYDSEKGLMMDVGEKFEAELSELPDIEQMIVCQVIINSAKDNGIKL